MSPRTPKSVGCTTKSAKGDSYIISQACLKNVTPPGETSFAKLVKLQAEIKSEKAKEHLKPVKVVGEDVTLQRAKLQGQIVSHKVKEQLKTVKPVEDIAVQRAKLQNEIVSDKAKQQLRQVKSPGESQFTRIVKLQGEIRKGTRLKPSENREEM